MAVNINGDGVLDVGGNATSAAYLRLYEDTDNGTNYVDVKAPASVTANRTITLPDDTGTILTNSGNQTGVFSALTVNSNNISADNSLGFRNRIINGDMRIDQRNAGASVTPINLQYTLDRWKSSVTAASKFSVQQNAGSVTPPVGFSNYLGVTSLSSYSVVSGDAFGVYQLIEGFNSSDLSWGTANAQTITISFWARSSLTGTFSGVIQNSASNRSYPFTYTINSANTWEQKSVTIAGDTTGTWVGATNGIGIWVYFNIGVGSTYAGTANTWSGSALYGSTSSTSVVGTNGATFYITGVQLEVGSVATPFERRPYGTELALCQRYYEKSYNMADVPGSSIASGAGYVDVGATSNGSNNAYYTIIYKVPKRGAATITGYTGSGTSGSWDYVRSGASGSGAIVANNTGENSSYIRVPIGAAWVACEISGLWTASAEL